MQIDPFLVVLAAIVVTAVLWIADIALGRVDRRVTPRGFRNGALVAATLFAITAVVVALVFDGRPVFLVALDLAGSIQLGLIVGAIVALGYLLIGAALIAIGLVFKSKPQWTTAGAWAAVPIVVVAGGFGYASYKSVNAEGAAASSANGALHLAISGKATGRISADGAATCATDAGGALTVDAGTTEDPRIISSDGRLISVRITSNPELSAAGLDLGIAAVDTSEVQVAVDTGSQPAAGQLELTAPGWSGTLAWSCNT